MEQKITVARYDSEGENKYTVCVTNGKASTPILGNCNNEFQAANLARTLSEVIQYPIEYKIEVTEFKAVSEKEFFTS